MPEFFDRRDAQHEPLDRASLAANEVPPGVEARLHAQLDTFREALATRNRSASPFRSMVMRLASAAVGAAITLVIVGALFGGTAKPTWADVVERFDTVPFFNATIYVRESALSQPVQLELWMSQGGRMRLRAGNRLYFGERGRIVEHFDIASEDTSSSSVRHAEGMVREVAERLGQADEFGLETFVQALPQRGAYSLPLENQNATISNDLVVFDIAEKGSPDWVRIWALRESRLPVRVKFWGANNAHCVDVALSYANTQPPEFFDPDAFRAAVEQGGVENGNRIYLLLKDPGGRPLTPADLEPRTPTETAAETI